MDAFMLRTAVEAEEGAGARVSRLMPVAGMRNFDPFVLWDHFRIGGQAGFPTHPHRGFEGVTYLLDGGMEHRDNLGNHSIVRTGGMQRFTAGGGIQHSEMPVAAGVTQGIQLWVNLPLRLKGMAPSYQAVTADQIPVETLPDGAGERRILAGNGSPLQLQTEVRYQDIRLRAGKHFAEDPPEGLRGFIYLMDGELTLGDRTLQTGQAAFMESGIALAVTAQRDSRFMLLFGRPHGEPIHQWGPYVD